MEDGMKRRELGIIIRTTKEGFIEASRPYPFGQELVDAQEREGGTILVLDRIGGGRPEDSFRIIGMVSCRKDGSLGSSIAKKEEASG